MASKSNGLETSEWARAPPSGSIWTRMGKAIYDPEEKSFLGRTPKRWGIVIIFYLVFYAVLAALFAICMAGLLAQIDPKIPYYTLERSLIGANPGVDYRPRPANEFQLKYDRNDSTALEAYKKQLEEFLQPSQVSTYTECVAADNYGIPETPCIYIKLNKIYGWEPDYYTASDLPSDMPDDLKEVIKTSTSKQVWVSCWDEKYNTTKIEYPWGRGMPSTYYPFRNEDGYISPLVAVRITPAAEVPPPSPVKDEERGVIIRCRAWAKNIEYNHRIEEASGYTRIRVLVEDDKRTE